MQYTDDKKREDRIRWIKRLLVFFSVLAAIKCIFVGLQMDEEYAITVPYRLLRGDRLFSELWDPHQTSAFFIQSLLWIYYSLFHTYTYSVIFVRVIGVLMHLGVSLLLWRGLLWGVTRDKAFYLAVFYFNLLPKGYVMPEFSNMMLWFMTLLLICATHRIKMEQDEQRFTLALFANGILMGILLSLLVLAYPTCVLVYLVVMVHLYLYDDFRWRSILTVTLTCVIVGGVYLLSVFRYMTFSQFVANVFSIVESCVSHADTTWNKLQKYLLDIPYVLLYVLMYGLLCALLIWIERRVSTKRKKAVSRITVGYVILWYIISAYLIQFVHWILMLWKYEYSYSYAIYYVIFGLGIYTLHHQYTAESDEQVSNRVLTQGGKLWLWSNIIMFVAILLLTNLNTMTSVKYLSSGVVACLVIILRYVAHKEQSTYERYAEWMLIIMTMVAIFIKGYVYIDNEGLMKNVTVVRKVIEQGPGKGIITEYMQGYMAESNYQEFLELIPEGATVLVVDSNTLCYMYQDVNIGSFTTICTPSYGDYFRDYWERYPEKYPDIIVISCWYGEMQYPEDNWMVQYAQTEYHPSQVVDGKYFRYFFR